MVTNQTSSFVPLTIVLPEIPVVSIGSTARAKWGIKGSARRACENQCCDTRFYLRFYRESIPIYPKGVSE